MKSIILGGGCFWCTEAVFQRVKGVEQVVSGYARGTSNNPTYNTIGDNAEVVRITYDETVIHLETLLEIFFSMHDPTTLNKQGNDTGTQYRSIIICSESELDAAQAAKEKAQANWQDPIVTELLADTPFYPAEDYHQDYYNQNQSAGYCQVIINPKLQKLQKKFSTHTK